MTESLVNEIMDTRGDEARELQPAQRLPRAQARHQHRHHRPQGPEAARGSYFPEDLVERFSRVDRAVIAAVSEMAAGGVSTRKVKRVAQGVNIDRMSASQVSRIRSSLDESGADLQERDLSDVIHPHPGTAWQRRVAHPMRSAAGNAPTRQKKGAVLGILKAVFAERDPELVRKLHRLATARIEGFCPKATEVLEEAEADAPAHLDFPHEHHVRLRANNVQERANREFKRRSRVVQVFRSRKALIRMMGAVFSEMDEDWAGPRWFGGDSIGRDVEGAKVNEPALAYEGTAAEHATRIIALVVADNPIPGRKAV